MVDVSDPHDLGGNGADMLPVPSASSNLLADKFTPKTGFLSVRVVVVLYFWEEAVSVIPLNNNADCNSFAVTLVGCQRLTSRVYLKIAPEMMPISELTVIHDSSYY